ncbi:hypothetical protein BGZ49_008669 [Haplosporangium sp. Z 27]|nr:hypothetical protein BGZ49_008669 [Haplosporangium sp. Z 27]
MENEPPSLFSESTTTTTKNKGDFQQENVKPRLKFIRWSLEEDTILYNYLSQNKGLAGIRDELPGRTTSAIGNRAYSFRMASFMPSDEVNSPETLNTVEERVKALRLLLKKLPNTVAKMKEEGYYDEKFKSKALSYTTYKRIPFSEDEKILLAKLVHKYRNSPNIWSDVSGGRLEDKEDSPRLNRTSQACASTWKIMNRAKDIRTGKWHEDEKQRLVEAIKEQVGDKYNIQLDLNTGNLHESKGSVSAPDESGRKPSLILGSSELSHLDWDEVARKVRTRDRKQCRYRFYVRMHNGRSGRWTDKETQLLKEGYELYGTQWRKVAAHVGTRTDIQRFHQCSTHSFIVARCNIMESLVNTLQNLRKRRPRTKSMPPALPISPSSSSNQDSAYGSATVFSSAAVFGISAQSRRISIDSNVCSESSQNQKNRLYKELSKRPKPVQITSTTCQVHKSTKPSLLDISPSPFPSVSFMRFKTAFSRLLPGKKDHHNHALATQKHQNLSSLTNINGDRLNGDQLNGSLFQQMNPLSLTGSKPPSFVSVHPFCSTLENTPTATLSLSIVDVTAPACFPGVGPVDMAAKHQQLLQLQQSSLRRSSAPADSSPALQSKRSRHLIPHHNNDYDVSQCSSSVSQEFEAYGSGLVTRSSSVGSITVASTSCPPSPLTASVAYNDQKSVSSWTTFTQDHQPSISTQSLNEMEFIADTTVMTKAKCPLRRGSNFSFVSDGLPMCTRERRTTSAKNKLGQGYDISTMFQLGPCIEI